MIQLEERMLAQPSCEVNMKLGTQNLLLFCLRIKKKKKREQRRNRNCPLKKFIKQAVCPTWLGN